MTLATQTNVNGIDVEALRGCIEACDRDPAQAQTKWRVTSQWVGGTRSDHHVDGVEIGGKRIERQFTLRTDEPHELVGGNAYANPQEYLLAALNACMMVGYAAVAALKGIQLTRLEVTVSGDIDLRGFLGLADVPRGYTTLHQRVRIAGHASREELEELHRAVQATSPNLWNITRPIQVTSELVID